MCGSMVDIRSVMAEIRRGKKEEEEEEETGQNIMCTSASAVDGGHNKYGSASNAGLENEGPRCCANYSAMNAFKLAITPPHLHSS